MAGLFSFGDDLSDPRAMGLLGMATGLLQAGAASPRPINMGEALGMGLQGAMSGYKSGKGMQMEDQRAKLMNQQMETQALQAKKIDAQMQRFNNLQNMVMSRLGFATPGAQQAPGSAQVSPVTTSQAEPFPVDGPVPAAPLQAPQPGTQGGKFPFSLNDLAALKVIGGPDLLDMFKYATDGSKRESGSYYVNTVTGQTEYMPKLPEGTTMTTGGAVMPLPGAAQANAAFKGAETGAVEAAKYPYTVGADRARQTTAAGLDLTDVSMPDGSKRTMPRLNAASLLGGGDTNGLGTTPSPVTQAAATGLNDNWIKNGYQPTMDAGKAATDISSSIQAVRNIDLNTGWGAEAKATAANVLTGLGIAPQNATMFAANAQKFQSVAMDRLMTTLMAQKGPQTEGDASRASQTFAALKNTPEANKFIMDFAQAKANMDMRKAQFYEQALPLAQKSGDLTRVDREWRKIQGSIWADPILQPWSKQ